MNPTAEMIAQICEVSARINIETTFCSFFSMSGHIGQISVDIRNSKDDFIEKVHYCEISYQPTKFDFCSKEENEEREKKCRLQFHKEAAEILAVMQKVLSGGWSRTYTAYCNLIDMSCSQVFVTKKDAEKWERKMKKKYKSVNPITGIIEEVSK